MTMTRVFTAPGVRDVPVRGGLYGELFRSARIRPPRRYGGHLRLRRRLILARQIAALLSSHGHRALALTYFRAPGLPRELKEIPLEYFARALQRLRRRPDVDPRRVAPIGISRGGDGRAGDRRHPQLVHGVIALVPSNVVNPSPDGHSPAWTLHGRPEVKPEELGNHRPVVSPQSIIPAEHHRPDRDRIRRAWTRSSYKYAPALHQRLDARHFRYPNRKLAFGERRGARRAPTALTVIAV